MTGLWMALAVAAAALGACLAVGRPRSVQRLRCCTRTGVFTWNPCETLLLQLMAAALERGASIPRALEAVGQACPPSTARRCGAVARALDAGVPWDDAWAVGGESEDDADDVDGVGAALALLADVLRPSWQEGVSAVGQLRAALDLSDTRARMRIEREASSLSVRLLLPTGLCFLPAFLCIAIVPAVISFARG